MPVVWERMRDRPDPKGCKDLFGSGIKKAPALRGLSFVYDFRLEGRDAGGLQTLGALLDRKLHALAFV